MKKSLISSIIFLILMLAACAPAPTTTSALIETPSPTPTKALPETPTQIPTPESQLPAESDLHPVYTETISEELLGVKITTNLITDKSLDPIITAIKINDHYTNSEGKNSKDALTEFTAKTFYKVWLKKGGVDRTGPKENVSFEDYMALWSKAQQSGLEADWRAVQITIKANDIATEGYEPVPTTIWFGYTGIAPEGVRAINEFNIAFVETHKVKNINQIGEISDAGFGTNIEDNKIYIYQGLISAGAVGTGAQVVAEMSLTSIGIIGKLQGDTSFDKNLVRLLSTKWRSVIQVFPQNETEKRYNP